MSVNVAVAGLLNFTSPRNTGKLDIDGTSLCCNLVLTGGCRLYLPVGFSVFSLNHSACAVCVTWLGYACMLSHSPYSWLWADSSHHCRIEGGCCVRSSLLMCAWLWIEGWFRTYSLFDFVR